MRFSALLLFCCIIGLVALPCLAEPAPVVPAAPQAAVVKGVSLVPLRAIADLCAATYTTKDARLTVTLGGHSLACEVGEEHAWQDGKAITLPMAPVMYLGSCYVPARALVTALGGTLAAPSPTTLQLTFPGAAPLTLPLTDLAKITQHVAGLPDIFHPDTLDQIQQPAGNLFLVKLDGSPAQQLTYDVVNPMLIDKRFAAFTADGKALYYVSGSDIVTRPLASPTATVLTAGLTKTEAQCTMPFVGKDGAVYFAKQPLKAETPPDICRLNADGTGFQRFGVGIFPQVGGNTIAYTSFQEKTPTVHVMNLDGTNDRKLADGISCAISPNGATLYYVKVKVKVENDTSSIEALVGLNVSDGKEIGRINIGNVDSDNLLYIRFSPDGKKLLMTAANGLQTTDADGKNPRQLSPFQDRCPQFNHDGTKIAFIRNDRLYVMNADGSALQQLAPGLKVDELTFAPDGKSLLVDGAVDQPASPAPVQRTGAAPTEAEVAAAKAAGTRTAVISTARGDITVELYGKEAPLTVANFVKLANNKFYNGLTFHRVEPTFVIQGGDPAGNGTGGPGYHIKLEIAPSLEHIDGALAMARSADPDSAGSQFYITIGAQHSLDGQYAVFGKVIKGMDVVRKIRIGDKIKSVKVK